MHPEQVLLLSFPSHEWIHILILYTTTHTQYAFYTERKKERKNYSWEGVRSQSPSAPREGKFFMNCIDRKSVGPPY
jgi:hypothetical protein